MIYKSGDDAIPSGDFRVIPQSTIGPGINILQYHVPAVAFKLLTAGMLQDLIDGWVWTQNEYALGAGGDLLDIKGVAIDDQSGDVFIKVNVSRLQKHPDVIYGQPADVSEAGVNWKAVVAIGGALFAALSIVGIGFIYAYASAGHATADLIRAGKGMPSGLPAPGTPGGGAPDPCAGTGILDSISCGIRRLSWLTLGAGVGVAVVLVYILVKSNERA